jgi:hypothetical protein
MRKGMVGALLLVLHLTIGCQSSNIRGGFPFTNQNCILLTVTNESRHKLLIDACVAQAGKRPWILLPYSPFFITQDDIDFGWIAILPPDRETKRIRRGKAFLNRNLLQYAQVAPQDRPFHGVYELPSLHEWPFFVCGDISDDDLSSLFDYLWKHILIRDSYAKEHIISVEVNNDPTWEVLSPLGTIRVTTGLGQYGHFSNFTRDGLVWEEVSFGTWIE